MPFLAPVFASVGAFVSTTLAAGGLGAFALRLGGSLLLSAASRALARKPDMGVTSQRVTMREPVAARQMVYGRTRKGGVIIFMDTDPADNGALEMVIVLASHRVHAIGGIYFDGRLVVGFGQSAPTEARYVNRVFVDRALGGDDQSAFTTLADVFPDKWTPNHRLRGCAAIRVRLFYDPDAFPGGIPNITADVWGKNDILDPRTGQRGYTENAALCLADFMAHPRFGLGCVIGGDIEQADLIEAANICDEAVPLSAGGTEPRYSCNGVVTLEERPGWVRDTIEAMLTAMSGSALRIGGRWHIRAGAYRVPEITLGVDDVRPGGLRLKTRVSMAENFNGVRGTFVSPENDWQPDDFPAVASATYLTEDNGERRWLDIRLPFTISAAAAQRLAKIELERARRQMTVQMAGKLSAFRLAPGDTVEMDYARWGFSGKPFEVASMTLATEGASLLPELVLRETSPLVYSWLATEEQIYAAAPRTNLPSAFNVAPPGILRVTEALYVTRAGDGVKAKATIDLAAAASVGVQGYEIEGRVDAGAFAPVARSLGELSVEVLDIAPGQWRFRARTINLVGVRSPWGPEFAVTIAGLPAPPVSLGAVSVLSLGGQALLRWTLSPDLDVRMGGQVLIRHSSSPVPTWANGQSLGAQPGGATLAVVPLLPGSYLLRAQDSSGVQGPVSIVSTDGVQALPFAPIGTLQEDTAFSGAHSGTSGAGGVLQIVPVGGNVPPQAIYTFAAGFDFGVVKAVRLRREIRMTPVYLTSDLYAEPDLWAMPDVYQSAPEAADVRVEISTTPDNPGGTPVWSPWRPLEADEVFARGVRARAILTTQDPKITPSVSRLRIAAHEVV